jgi:hypothetical protein
MLLAVFGLQCETFALYSQLGKIEVGSSLFPINHAMTDAIEKLFST